MLYALINSNGIEAKKSEQMLTLKEMQQLVGIQGESAYIEAVYNQFTDPTIVLLCDDEFLLKGFSPTCKTKAGLTLHGQVLVLSTTDSDFCLLTEEQFAILKAALLLNEENTTA
ncbi:DUF3846 domain-containing protein [Kamptonema sp. UHCC 0994]|uniref:DUF3846 domain-containing protein n=1 Tax=Kamptonema sp. UHCC 0994 TaxID=3031329 RepID=UPI0023B90C14|nr:DUF3846 domain-containing protein [Kamptonema sp. UHCC 0994]MDF0553128.1 DUF3846 domain-containing protein [Kamptonema sp. UHCC 0994]